MLADAAQAPTERVYWYSLIDLDSGPTIEGCHVDENEHQLGLVHLDGARKPAYELTRDLLARERQRVAG